MAMELDGSAKWDVTDQLQFRLQVSNLLGKDTIVEQQINEAGDRFRRGRVKGDRRIKFGLRYNFW